jgi:hypothetical protein
MHQMAFGLKIIEPKLREVEHYPCSLSLGEDIERG